MSIFRATLPIVSGLLCAGLSCAPVELQHPEWQAQFARSGVSAGCMLVYDLDAEVYHRHNPERCAGGFLPASTFKLMNSLVALETGVAPGVDFVLEWDGQQRWLPVWNQDHSMRSAMQHSTVWYFQEIARRIGVDRMRTQLQRAGYGNGDLSAGIDRFWLEGDFRISPEAQIDFLRRLEARELPFSDEHQEQVLGILVREAHAGIQIAGKTGLALDDDSGAKLGWWIGYAQHANGRAIFALNIAGGRQDELMEFAAKRKTIARAVLAEYFADLD